MSENKPDSPTEITFVNRFTLHAAPEEFERIFAETSAFMARRPGFVRNTLLRHVNDETIYINIAHWQSADALRQAIAHPSFQPHAAALRAISTSDPHSYTPRQAFSADGPPTPGEAEDPWTVG
ncbi:antibiotic biosynthesis monooxygenase [Streptomyces griseus]|uniref:antibiotic biosynthesis monooxygenase family protein n=1 Tax=Streptomyces griseus TaxID=1911 RepID=UPI00068D7E99|nr:antibiotic biosynthesis monooxygenase family protein [Streptomyces griseus]